MFDIHLPEGIGFEAVPRGDEDPLLPDERMLVSDRAVATRRTDVQLGRTAARRALIAAGHATVPIGRGDLGEPIWPNGMVGSITHSNGWGLAMVASRVLSGGIGIDLESRSRYFPELIEQVCGPAEQRWLDALTTAERPVAALEVFALKEAIYKAFAPRVRRFFGFEAVTVGREDGRYRITFDEHLDPVYPPGRPVAASVDWFDELVLAWLVLPPDQPLNAVSR